MRDFDLARDGRAVDRVEWLLDPLIRPLRLLRRGCLFGVGDDGVRPVVPPENVVTRATVVVLGAPVMSTQ